MSIFVRLEVWIIEEQVSWLRSGIPRMHVLVLRNKDCAYCLLHAGLFLEFLLCLENWR
jgi:hypothetical protein